MCFAAAFYFWRLGDRWAAKKNTASAVQRATSNIEHPTSNIQGLAHRTPSLPFQLLSQAGTLNIPPATDPLTNQASRLTNHLALRLSNTPKPLRELQRSDTAILLENALLDTAQTAPLAIPNHLRAQGDPGSYVVQASGLIDAGFRSLLKAAGASVVSYIPNNAYLVRASGAGARQLQADPRTQSVLPYEPYYKLKPSLLKLAVAQEPLPDDSMLNLLLFADAREQTLADLANLGVKVLAEDRSPFGPVLRVLPPVESLPFVAGLPGVHELEMAAVRVPANDLSRVQLGVSTDTLGLTNYLGLTGTNVLVNVNDSGVDATQPDLSPRVTGSSAGALVDLNGHGTHVAGIIASSGGSSTNPVNVGAFAGGSLSNANFRGKAPGAKLFVQPVAMYTKPMTDGSTLIWPSDSALQEGAARTNAFISNNSWNYVGTDSHSYDIHAASYDAAVRDALPTVSGSQPLLIVFPAGNSGVGDSSGGSGFGDTVETPGTAKNVITVGAIELLRNITNEYWKCSPANSTNNCITNQPWLRMTDSSDQVAAFSSRGNVGVGIEGDFGRFKPDVVAPGTFVVSTKSAQWDTNSYYNPTSHIYFFVPDVVIASNDLYFRRIFVPDNAVQVYVALVPNTNSPVPFPDLPIFVKRSTYPTNAADSDFVGTNQVSMPPDLALDPSGTYYYFAVGNYATPTVRLDLFTDVVVTNALGNYLQVLAGMNDALGPYYRYESGTSMSAADASGTLALMQEFFESRLKLTNHSPALMKAMLINGARTVSGNYDFNVQTTINSQGWGLINLPTTLPGSLTNLTTATNSIIVFDQDPTNSLATGQSHTRRISLSPTAQRQLLRITLVWTDPPGDPIASVKLVNDLNLIVTNLDTSEVFFGNDIQSGSDFNIAWATNTIPNVDTVNNVENVYLSPSLTTNSALGTNYSITVVGRRVNVNAVTANANNVAQDYALVISSGDGDPESVLTLSSLTNDFQTKPLVTIIPNMFTNAPGFAGGLLFNQRAGANTPLLGTNSILLPTEANGVLTLGMTNQWHFYAITNTTTYTNAAFLTFLPPNLAVPREGVFQPTAEQATRPQADIDLYVAPPRNPANYSLTNLAPLAVRLASKSLSRGGTETIVYSNATPGIYYIGVKSEDHQAAEYALMGVFSELPFGSTDDQGNQHLLGFPTPMPVPDGSPQSSQASLVMAIAVQPIKLHRVVVTNVVAHELMTDLVSGLSHAGQFAILHNHTCVNDPITDGCETWTSYIYDDSAELNVGPSPFLFNPHVQHTDGPGSLVNFANTDGVGQWMLSMVDNATNHIGTNMSLQLFLELQQDMASSGGVTAVIQGGACRADYVDVPPEAVGMTVDLGVVSGTPPIKITLQICPAAGGDCKGILITNTLGGAVTVDQTDLPPLQAGGTYVVRTCNLDTRAVTVNLRAKFSLSLNTITPVVSVQTTTPVPIRDDAITDIHLTNYLHNIISSLDVGLLLSDPRVSDLAITLISPNGTRVLLFEDRGALTTNGLGIGTFGLSVVTNMAPFYTNNFNLAPVGFYAPGAMFQGWSVLSNMVDVLDDYTCFCLSNHVLGLLDGGVSNSLPTTNALASPALNPYTLSYRVNHLPWIEGMVTWWPLDVDGSDIFGGFNGLLLGDVYFATGKVSQAFIGDGLATRMVVPRCPELDLGRGRGFSIEGWIKPGSGNAPGTTVMTNGFEGVAASARIPTGSYVSGWHVDAGDIDLLSSSVAPFPVSDSGTNCIDIAGTNSGTISTNLTLVVGHTYRLNFAYSRNADSVIFNIVSQAAVNLAGANLLTLAPNWTNSWSDLQWQHTSVVFTASAAVSKLEVKSLTTGLFGVLFDSFSVTELGVLNPAAAPLVEWYDAAAPTNLSRRGVQFWVGLTNGPGSLTAILWDTISQPHPIATPSLALTNGGWQHVALTYDTNSGSAVLYTNGQSAARVQFLTNFVPRTSGDLYLGYDPAPVPAPISYTNFTSIAGLNLVGSAAQTGSVLRLTPAAAGQVGNAWATNKLSCAAGFDTRFQFQMSNPGGGGGDGIAFVVQNVGPSAPESYVALGNGTNYLAVDFNTFLNAQTDVSSNSVGIVTNNGYVAQVDLTPLGINLKDGAVHQGRITYNGTGMSVYLDGLQLFTDVPIPAMAVAVDAAGDGWVGFSGICGTAWENQDILSWTFGRPNPGTAFAGGLDEFSVYQRSLSPCEVNAIFNAGSRGKYGANALTCPVATEVTLLTASGSQTYAFTNGLTWTNNGPLWETNTISFSTSTNPTAIVVRGLNPYNPADTNSANNLNAMVDDFVLSGMVTNTINGLLHFTENTNLATLPIKFAPAPYNASNFPPALIFSNGFSSALAGLYNVGATISGGPNSPAIGTRNWTVTQGPVTVVSNAWFDAAATNSLALATGAVQCLLPTVPGHRYQLTYNLRGPCAVGWWNGSVDPLSQRAQDLISANNGAFLYGATNTTAAYVGDISQTYVGPNGFFFSGQTEPPPAFDPDLWPEDVDDPGSKIELGDPPQLQFTNAFTIEAWINPVSATNGTTDVTYCGTEQIFFRGYPDPYDCRGLGDPYWLALEPSSDPTRYNLHFHIGDAYTGSLGADVLTTNGPVQLGGGSSGGWWHIAAVFDKPVTNISVAASGTNVVTITTNAMRLYVNGVCVATNYTTLSPYQDLDPALSPGVTIGNRSRYDWTQPFLGFMDELTVYARALTGPEIAAIAAAGSNGKATYSLPPALSLAALKVSVDGAFLDAAYGDNSQWNTHSVEFTALQTNAVLALQSLQPGTLLDGITLSEVPSELYYLPEVPLSDLYGQDAFGVWTLEIWDTRVGPANTNAQLLQWVLNFGLAPVNPPPVISLSHGISYTNSLPANSIQYFLVQVPQWATRATNTLEFAVQAHTSNPLPVSVLFNQTTYPSPANPALIGPLVSSGTVVLATNTTPPLVVGQTYYLAFTNPNPVAVTFALGVWFDITTLPNCQKTAGVVGPAGIPRYFQFDVPTNALSAGVLPQAVAVWLSGANSNLTLVLSEHLPLPDLNHYDYISQQPSTNDEIVMLVTNATPFPIQTNRWYVGVYNTAATNVAFSLQACLHADYPVIIPLTNGIPFVVPSGASAFAAPPGPPQQVFFDFLITGSAPGVLFELYNLSGDADLVLQQDSPPTMAPYFDGSFFPGTAPEQIVLRTSAALPDLRGHWYLGVYNNELFNVGYTIRATLPNNRGLLLSAQPLKTTLAPLNPPQGLLLSWNSVEGEHYFVQYTASIAAPVAWTNIGFVTATTPLTTFEVVPVPDAPAFFRIVQVSSFYPKLYIQTWSTNQVRVSWSTGYPDYTLQSKIGLFGAWSNAGLPLTIVGNDYVAFDAIGPDPKYYRLIK
jgi:subtilisin-like proprotein convertase family protein